MRSRVFLLEVLVCLLFTAMGLCACGASGDGWPADCPFSHLTWSSSMGDVVAEEGEEHGSYDSVYGGVCYTYPKELEGRAGTVKYMFDGDGKLAAMAWTWEAESQEELEGLYDTLYASLSARYGESGYSAGHQTNRGGVWYLDSGDIILSAMTTSEVKALQYSYLSPAVSKAAGQ